MSDSENFIHETEETALSIEFISTNNNINYHGGEKILIYDDSAGCPTDIVTTPSPRVIIPPTQHQLTDDRNVACFSEISRTYGKKVGEKALAKKFSEKSLGHKKWRQKSSPVW